VIEFGIRISLMVRLAASLILILIGETCAPMPVPTFVPNASPTRSITAITPRREPSPTAPVPPMPIPQIPGLVTQSEFDAQQNLGAVHYCNSAGTEIALFDPNDKTHNQRIIWRWEKMSTSEKHQALQWLFHPLQMCYGQFENQEDWLINALTQWIPRMNDFAIPTDPVIAIHWQSDGPQMSQDTLYESLSRVKALTLVRERRLCSYGHSHLGLIEYGGEIILFSAPGWQKVSVETRQILTTVWTIKEAMVIYYPQSQGWASSCPSESEHLKNEYYSTIWLLKAEQVFSKFVPADRGYWEGQELGLQIRNIVTQSFPRCLPPFPVALPTPGTGDCSQSP
jgi:hypothetical protein